MGLRRLFLLLTAFIITTAVTVRADVYVADNFRADSIYAYPVKISKTDTVPDFNTRVPIACGDTLLCEVGEDGQASIVRHVGSDYALMSHASGYYLVSLERIKFCSSPSGKNALQDEVMAFRHTELGKKFFSMKPFYLCAALLVIALAIVMILRRMKYGPLAVVMLYALPTLLTAVCALEIATLIVTNDLLWWVNLDKLGFWPTLLRTFPLSAAIVLQIYVGIAFKQFLENVTGGSLTLLPAFIGVVISVVATVVVTFIMALAHIGGDTQASAALIALLGSIAVGLIWTFLSNWKRLSLPANILFTFFGFIYALGCFIAVLMGVIVLTKLLIHALIWIFFLSLIIAFICSGGKSAKTPELKANSPVKRQYKDAFGGLHDSKDDAQWASWVKLKTIEDGVRRWTGN